MKNSITVVTVVRNFMLYDRLVKNNPFLQSAMFYSFDNSLENKHVSARYNEFLDLYDFSKESWFVFCHEDWELKEDISEKLKNVDKNFLYGPIGTVLIPKNGFYLLRSLGGVKNSDKQGKNIRFYGHSCANGTIVDTFDCQCLIVHSSLVQKYALRFDEKLAFDLYVEDFCANAKEQYGIVSKIINLKCQHYSYGTVLDRFHNGFVYLKDKYRNASYSYSNCLITETFGKELSLCIKRDAHGVINSLKRRIPFLYKLY